MIIYIYIFCALLILFLILAPKNSVQDSLILNQEHSNTRSNARDDDPDLGKLISSF